MALAIRRVCTRPSMFVCISVCSCVHVCLSVCMCMCVFVGTCLSVCFPKACVSNSPKQAYLGIDVALTDSPWRLAAKAFSIASVIQDYNQDMYKSIGQQLLYSSGLLLCRFASTVTYFNCTETCLLTNITAESTYRDCFREE